MCGIFGFTGPPAPDLLAAMAERLRHRGPDEEGAFCAADLSLGADRLAIVGVTNGHQPFVNEDGSVVLVCNGEIYNFQPLRQELERRGHRFATATDGEVIVHLYEEEGEAAVARLEGMFAWALWDGRRKRLLIARDAMGMKPLFYVRHDGRFAFASEVKALLCLPGLERRVDLTALDGLIRRGITPEDRTLFTGIRRLPPGHLLCLENDEIELRPYWRLLVRPDPRTGADPAGEFVPRFLGAVGRHLVGDVPVGAALSGGLDSSLVVAAMSRLTGAGVKTFSVGFRHDFDERPFARLVAEHCRTDHHEVTLEGEDLLRALPLLLWHAEEPRSAPLLPQSLLFERAAREVRVVLMGEGADELFGGYARLKTALGPLAYLPASWGRSAYLVARHGGGRGQAPFTDGTRQAVDQAAGEARLGEVFRQRGVARAEALLAYEQGERMPKSTLMQVDLMAMSHSVEARLPFLDTQIVQLANRLPVRWKTRWRGEKRLLRLAARELLPPAIAARPKLGIANPLRTWNAAGFLDLARELLSPAAIERRGIFRQPHLASLLRRAERGRMLPFDLHRLHLFVLIEAWHRVFIDPPRCAPPPPALFLRQGSG